MKYQIISFIVKLVLLPFTGKVRGIENVPKKGGAIIAANHSSYLDHLIIGCAFVRKAKRPFRTLAKKEHFYSPFERMWHNYLGAIPLDRQAGGEDALHKAAECLRKGELIMIYPEGTRTLTGKMSRAKTGVVRLALEARVPVIPIGLTNTFYILPKGRRIPKFGKKADLNIGKPIHLDSYYSKNADKRLLRKLTR